MSSRKEIWITTVQLAKIGNLMLIQLSNIQPIFNLTNYCNVVFHGSLPCPNPGSCVALSAQSPVIWDTP